MQKSERDGTEESSPVAVSRRRVLAVLAAGPVVGLLGRAASDSLGVPSASAARGKTKRVTANSRWRETGDAGRDVVRREFARFRSPMLAEAEAIHRRADGLSRLYLAMSYMEKKHDTYTETIPASFRNALAVKRGDGSGRWDRYALYRAGAAAWAALLLDPRGPYAETVSLRDLVEVYAPSSENDVGRYVDVLVQEMNRYERLRAG